jgi:hypothetical protein
MFKKAENNMNRKELTVMLSGIAFKKTFPSVFSKKQCSSRMLSPLRRMAAGFSLSRRPTYVHGVQSKKVPQTMASTHTMVRPGLIWYIKHSLISGSTNIVNIETLMLVQHDQPSFYTFVRIRSELNSYSKSTDTRTRLTRCGIYIIHY